MKAVASTENSAAISPAARETRTSAGAAPLRVLHVIDRLDMGGTEYVILKVMAGLGGGEFEHRVCAARGYNESLDRKSTRLNSSHLPTSRMPSSA